MFTSNTTKDFVAEIVHFGIMTHIYFLQEWRSFAQIHRQQNIMWLRQAENQTGLMECYSFSHSLAAANIKDVNLIILFSTY